MLDKIIIVIIKKSLQNNIVNVIFMNKNIVFKLKFQNKHYKCFAIIKKIILNVIIINCKCINLNNKNVINIYILINIINQFLFI